MCGLAHYLEEEGLATTLIALVRPHAEKIQPPRALWVPFELGRPLGEPNDPDFQRAVVRTALALLEREDGPVLLEDYAEEAPGASDDPSWTPPSEVDAEDLASEVAKLRAAHARAIRKFGRTTVGVSGVDLERAAAYLQAYDSDSPEPNPRRDMADVLMLRFAADDLKAYYLEAAASGPGRPSSRQLEDWFWNHTRAAERLRELRARSLRSEDAARREVGGHCLVPSARVKG